MAYTALPFAPSLLIAAQPGCTSCQAASAGGGGGGGSGGPGTGGSGGTGGGGGGPTGVPPGAPPGTYPLGGGVYFVPGVGVVSADELPGMDEAPAGGGGDTTARKRRPFDWFWLIALLALATGYTIGEKRK